MLPAAEATTSGLTASVPCWHTPRRSCVHHKCAINTRAQVVDRALYPQQVHQVSEGERLLRYPDGRVRCIRYPPTTITQVESPAEQIDPTVSYEEDWDPDRWDDIDWAWDTPISREGVSAYTHDTAHSRQKQPSTIQESPPKVTILFKQIATQQQHGPPHSNRGIWQLLQMRHTFNSPADLLRALNAEGYMQAQQELMDKVQNSYEVKSFVQLKPSTKACCQ